MGNAREIIQILEETIYSRARRVDEMTQVSFIEKSRTTPIRLPPAGDILISENLMNFFYDIRSRIDGRVLARKFIDYQSGKGNNYQIARPQILDDPDFNNISFARMDKEKIRRISIASDKKPGTTDLVSYSEGRLEVVGQDGEIFYYLTGCRPETIDFSVRARDRMNHKEDYEQFVKSMSS